MHSYPVILTLENHCSIENSDIMKEIIVTHLSGKISLNIKRVANFYLKNTCIKVS
jgi:hypothetical protein